IRYLTVSGRDHDRIALVEAYCKAQAMWRADGSSDPIFTDTLELDLSTVVPSMDGPKRPEGRIPLENVASGYATALTEEYRKDGSELGMRFPVEGRDYDIG